MQSLIRQDQPRSLFLRQSVLDQRQIQIFVAAINLVPDDGMPNVREVDADLMLAA